MVVVRKTLTLNDAPSLSPAAVERLETLSPEDIEANARDDPDNPPISEEELARGLFGRRVRLARETLKLSQREFSTRFRVNLRRLQDWEQGRVAPDSAISAYMTLIEREPEMVRRVLAAA